MTNIAHAEKVLTFLRRHPHRHNQSVFMRRIPFYGQVGCVAGWTVDLIDHDTDPSDCRRLTSQARLLLDLTYDQAEVLFFDMGPGSARRARKLLARYIEDAKRAEQECARLEAILTESWQQELIDA